MKRITALILAMLLTGWLACAEGGAAPKVSAAGVYTSIDQLSGKRIGSATGTTFDQIVQRWLPDAQFSYYNTLADMVKALESGKIDAFACEEPVLLPIMAENSRVTMLPQYLDTFEFGYIFPKDARGEALSGQMSELIGELRQSGELSEINDKWLTGGMDDAQMPDIDALGGENGRLTLALDAMNPPFDFVRGSDYAGLEVELAIRFCERFGYALDIKNMDFDAVLTSVQTGKADFACATISITDERRQSVNFSEPHYSGGTVLAVLKDEDAAAELQPELTDFSDLSGKTVSMLTSAPFEALVRRKAPDVGKFTYFNSNPDMIQALKARKTDAFLMNNAVSQLALNRNADLALFPQSLEDGTFGIAFAKGDPRRDAWQAAYDAIPRSEIERAWEKWIGADDSVKILPEQDWPGLNGTVQAAVCDTLEPMSYVGGDNVLKGFDLEVILMTARALDVKVAFTGMSFTSVLDAVQSGKADLAAGSIIISEERAESVDFMEYYPASFVLVVRGVKASGAEATREDSALSGIAASFHKTFIREGRWKLFSDGVLTTLLIAVCAVLLGTALGFSVFMLCRRGNPAANLITRFCLWLVQGMPMVVLLMILYYVVFGSVAINGIVVAVIGFTLTFGAAVFGLLKIGVGAVEGGQYEAACALGYSDRRTFFKIILPQALPHVLPAYKGEIVGLIKATAVVGYIAVQDLTKMGDIVRSRTYEAFFPLIAVTIIYFLLEGLIGIVLSKISAGLNPKRRSSADILKGVKTDDQD